MHEFTGLVYNKRVIHLCVGKKILNVYRAAGQLVNSHTISPELDDNLPPNIKEKENTSSFTLLTTRKHNKLVNRTDETDK